jgi:hypothetical protein
VATAALVLGDFIAPLNFNGFRMLPHAGSAARSVFGPTMGAFAAWDDD